MNNPEEIICNCNRVTRGEIEHAIKTQKLTTVEEVGDATGASQVCGACEEDVQAILDELNK